MENFTCVNTWKFGWKEIGELFEGKITPLSMVVVHIKWCLFQWGLQPKSYRGYLHF